MPCSFCPQPQGCGDGPLFGFHGDGAGATTSPASSFVDCCPHRQMDRFRCQKPACVKRRCRACSQRKRARQRSTASRSQPSRGISTAAPRSPKALDKVLAGQGYRKQALPGGQRRVDADRDVEAYYQAREAQQSAKEPPPSKYVGVCWDRRRKRWVARSKKRRKLKAPKPRLIGVFDTEAAAALAPRPAPSMEIHGFTENHGYHLRAGGEGTLGKPRPIP